MTCITVLLEPLAGLGRWSDHTLIKAGEYSPTGLMKTQTGFNWTHCEVTLVNLRGNDFGFPFFVLLLSN